ncbi:MAG: hypothetical protein C0626_00860 [Arcobacter sp.]|uniref:DUF1853 family protein n=1 Tax=uncultured Arcobacter sp. TaxID=165434 RepID=UPI000CBDE0F7|nr:DUF1853 family protein [uncultured Arcobacter sp.]PLY11150.1 MAG: hypothetical protein C0626_00860 [Arcobacter sp.]
MNNLKIQFLGFMNTPSLFKELYGLTQIQLDIDEVKEFDFTQLNITSRLTLGSRIERFFEFYIKQSKNYELIKNNIQIIHNKQTLGEIDFLIYDKKAEEYLHVEHVYKFYLYDDSISNEIDRYIGPNRNDTFVKKLEKLKNKQLPLLYKNETREYLDGMDINSFKQKICLKGNIYVPMHLVGCDIPILNNSCVRGFYINREEFIKKKHFKEFEYFLPARNDWVCDCNTNETWRSFDEVIDEIELLLNQQKSPLVWLKNTKENKTQSFFITWW